MNLPRAVKLQRPLANLLLPCLLLAVLCSPAAMRAQGGAEPAKLISSQELESLFPPSVFFQGRTAPIQMRNAAALRISPQGVFFAGLVDNSGYASAIQQKYQMYLLAEQPMLLGDKILPAGAYGAGFVGDRFLVMDLGGHTVAEGPTQMEEHLARPRPLQILLPSETEARLYLGRRWIRIAAAPSK